jgi:hypothetical protein
MNHRWTYLNLGLSVASFIALRIAMASSEYAATAYGFVALVLFLFGALPTLLLALLSALGRRTEHHRGGKTAGVLLAVGLLLWNGFLAFELGFFGKAIGTLEREVSERADPAQTSLRRAVLTGGDINMALLDQALQQGADPNASVFDEAVLPVLMYSVTRADIAAMTRLLDAGADPNLPAQPQIEGIDNPRPLDVAIASGNRDAVRLLIERGATTENAISLERLNQMGFAMGRQW